jgi:glutamine synthetase
MLTLETLPHHIQSGDVDTVVVAFPDLYGRPVGKRVTGAFFLEEVMHHGIEVCDYVLASDIDMEPLPDYGFTGWERGYGDLHAVIDPRTLRPLPWVPGSALVLCDLQTTDGRPVEVSPRRMLRRQIERAASLGFQIKCATELEFYLFRDSYDEASAKGWKGIVPHADTIEDYQLLQTSRDEYVIGVIRRQMLEAGIPVEFSKGEAGPGQHEINVTYDDALETADRHLVFKTGVKEIAAGLGRSVTFMAKWSMDCAGSSCHIHTSVWDLKTGRPLMPPEDRESRPSGLSVVGEHFLAGQIRATRELQWCFAPTVNSYRRYVPGSWAPTGIAWGEDNRTCGFRTVGAGPSRRVESRIPGADVNPYVALAAAIAGGLWGVERELPLEDPFSGNAYQAPEVPRLPSALIEAVDALEASEVAVEAFGSDVRDHLVNTARQEWLASNRVVTDWELARNFERI